MAYILLACKHKPLCKSSMFQASKQAKQTQDVEMDTWYCVLQNLKTDCSSTKLVSLTSLFSTNVAISEKKGQGWRAIPTQYQTTPECNVSNRLTKVCWSLMALSTQFRWYCTFRSVRWEINVLLSTNISYIGDKVLGGDLVPPA